MTIMHHSPRSVSYSFTFTGCTGTMEKSYFGRRVSVLFDDGNKYTGVIIGKDPQTSQWITRFEDGTEDRVNDPATDKDYTSM